MKLLGWMHRKFRQNEPLKDFCIGQAYNCLKNQPSTEDHHVNNKSSPYMGLTQDDHDHDHDQDHYYEDLFHGFLAIGTLGSTDPMCPSTPTFEFSLENITENDEATEDELKLINDELEKVLVEEEESARNSHASGGGRSSHGSTITLSGKGLVEAGRVSNGVCPLQEYLFGSAVEIDPVAEGEKLIGNEGRRKEARTSLGELFQRSKMGEDHDQINGGGEEKKKSTEKDAGEKFHVQVMKKMMMKKLLHACSKKSDDSSGSGSGGGSDYGSAAEKKLHKIMRMFHKKVHPESTESGQAATARKAGNKSEKHKEKKKNKKKCSSSKTNNNEARDGGGGAAGGGEAARRGYIRQPNPVAEFSFDDCESNGSSRECWIKTDAQYLVLEL